MWSIHTGVELEKRGIPTAVICTTAFAHIGRQSASAMGIEGLPIVVAPHPFDALSPEAVHQTAERIADEIVHILTTPAADLEQEYAGTWSEAPADLEVACSLPPRSITADVS